MVTLTHNPNLSHSKNKFIINTNTKKKILTPNVIKKTLKTLKAQTITNPTSKMNSNKPSEIEAISSIFNDLKKTTEINTSSDSITSVIFNSIKEYITIKNKDGKEIDINEFVKGKGNFYKVEFKKEKENEQIKFI